MHGTVTFDRKITGKCACFRGWGSERGAGSLGDCSKRRQ